MLPPIQRSNYFLTAAQTLCTFAPATLSVLLRPKFEPLLNSKERQVVYFFIGTFVPTVLALRWQQLAWKTSFAGALFFSFIAKKISDFRIGSQLGLISVKPLSIAKWTRQNPVVLKAPSLLQNVSISTAAAILHRVIPGEYEVTVDERIVQISNPQIANAVRFWLGKEPEAELTLDDIDSLKVYMRYRSLAPEEKMQVRQELYHSFYPLVSKVERPITLSYVTGYSGDEILLQASQGETLKIQAKKHNRVNWTLTISESGECTYEDKYISMKNEDRESLTLQNPEHFILKDQPWLEGEWIFEKDLTKDKPTQVTELQDHLDRGPAHLELLVFKRDQIVAFLEGKMELQVQHAFATCCALLNSFSAEGSVRVKDRGDQNLVEGKKEERIGYELGPIWSPVANSEDSFFTWTFEALASGQKSLHFKKGSAGRGMVGGTAQRNVTLTTGSKPTELRLEIAKSNANDLEHYASTSVYLLEELENGRVQVRPQGTGLFSHCEPFILGQSTYHDESSHIQTRQEVQQDMDFILKVLSTLSDIKASPDTMLLDKQRNLVCNLKGNPIPVDRIKLLSEQRQGGIGHPLVWYDTRGKEPCVKAAGGEVYLTYKGATQPMLEDRRDERLG